ncbi:MAG TPA: hypothetical protein VHW73_00815 [Rudaea sp.]|jgi:hypothetical protein|nr:hypothetical protein [Rudaea sp.]
MRKNKAYLLLAIVALAIAGFASAAGFSSLEERMSQAEFHAAGLDKLSPDELKTLDDWVNTHIATKTTYVSPTGAPVFYAKSSDREVVESRIAGKFSGWYGKNVFKLENGQEWTQAESGTMSTGNYDHPKVKIKPMLVGSWLMYVEACGCSVRVDRTK